MGLLGLGLGAGEGGHGPERTTGGTVQACPALPPPPCFGFPCPTELYPGQLASPTPTAACPLRRKHSSNKGFRVSCGSHLGRR